ncbi:MAG: glycine zipper 2TM domain-containing protein [Gammaproteobacteria bacterium]|nr:glycine zipper 2TM domain-containing protein [Gammaproteobacteria bacterium]
MNKIINNIILFAGVLSLTSCAQMTQQDVGVLAGGVAGGLLGSTIGAGDGRLVAIAAGTLAGAYIGGSIGKNMDANDRQRMNRALEHNNIGQPAYWRNAHSGTAYEVVPTRNVTVHGNEYCREYRTQADIGGKKQQIYGTACRQPDGAWKAVS